MAELVASLRRGLFGVVPWLAAIGRNLSLRPIGFLVNGLSLRYCGKAGSLVDASGNSRSASESSDSRFAAYRTWLMFCGWPISISLVCTAESCRCLFGLFSDAPSELCSCRLLSRLSSIDLSIELLIVSRMI